MGKILTVEKRSLSAMLRDGENRKTRRKVFVRLEESFEVATKLKSLARFKVNFESHFLSIQI